MPAPHRRARLSALVLLAALAACREHVAPRPDVLLITLGATRADALSCYGAPPGATPALDTLAGEGVRFDLALSTAALAPVAHASILTGLDNWRHGVRVLAAEAGHALPRTVPSLASILRGHGWSTAAFHSACPASAQAGLGQGFDVFESFDASLEQGKSGLARNAETLMRRSEATTELALRHLADAGVAPTFLWAHYSEPHDAGRLPPPEGLSARAPGPDGGLLRARALYAAEVGFMDSQIGRLLEGLRARGRWDNTLVVVVADHGEGLQDHGWPFHRVLYQEQLRVPLLLRIPASLGKVRRPTIEEVVSVVDLVPTVLDYLDLAAPPVSGRSLRSLIEGARQGERVVFADALNGYDLQATGMRARPQDDFSYCATDGRFKLIYRPAHPHASELFDLVRDPRELVDLSHARRDQFLRLVRELASSGAWVSAPFAAQGGHPMEASAPRAQAPQGYASDGELPQPLPRWAWVCPLHPGVQRPAPLRCPYENEPPVLIAAGAELFPRHGSQR